jgi:hypothetical protein
MDNRIQLPTDEINFQDVGFTGQDHDNYAQPGSLTRYDWARMLFIGLLANQSSNDNPEEFRPGTMWFDFNTMEFKSFIAPDAGCTTGVVAGEDFDVLMVGLAAALSSPTDQSLEQWSESIQEKIDNYLPTGLFSGVAQVNSDVINLPKSVQSISIQPNKPYLYKNGKLIDPNLTSFNDGACPVCVKLSDQAVLSPGDKFTVIIQK